MTREEAIEVIKQDIPCEHDTDLIEALDMAIKALSQEPCDKCKYFDGNSCQHYDYKVGYTQGYEDASKRFRPEPCDDCKHNNEEWDSASCDGCCGNHSGYEPCDDAISINAVDRFGVLNEIYEWTISGEYEQPRGTDILIKRINNMPSVTQKSGKCKNCKYFEYDSVAKVDGVPLIVAHEICSRWGDGCKTREDGYCFLYEPQESEDKE